jgi:phenylacetate-coenzyme A ligase PaaK-like adenylate-forming protein
MRLRGILGISVLVTLVEAGTLPRTEGKGVRFVDRRVPA